MNKKSLILSITATLTLLAIGFSYAYFTAILNGNSEEVYLTAGALRLSIADGNNLIGNVEVIPGDVIEKTFTIENTGDMDASYDLWLSDVYNNFVTKSDLVFKLIDTESNNELVSETIVPSEPTKILSDYPIDVEEVQHLKLVVTYKDVNRNQSDNKNKLFTFKLRINEGKVLELNNEYYLNNVLVTSMPDNTYYYDDHASYCNNGADIIFNESDWTYTYDNVTTRNTTCKFYFVNKSTGWQLPGGVDLKTGMTAIKYVDGKIYKADTNEEWYNYRNHEWANAAILTSSGAAKTNSQELDPTTDIYQMYVWIPRYKYQLFNTGNETSVNEQVIRVKFQSTLDTKANGSSNGEWLTHPAFTFGNTELNGIWVGKFEPSIVDSSENNYMVTTDNELACSDENCTNAQYIRILPNNISLTKNNISNEFYASRSIENTNTFGLNSLLVDTHMMKNMEWGAIAYLTQSKYGIFTSAGTCANSNQTTANGCEVFINNVNVGYGEETNTNNLTHQWGPTITGCSAQTAESSAYNTHNETNPTCQTGYTWNQNGVLASTTGNMYGVYDLSGGAYENVMANKSSSSTEFIFVPRDSAFATAPNSKYYDQYLASSISNTDNIERFDQKRGQLGDATKEVLKSYGIDDGSWNDDRSRFLASSRVWFQRGGKNSNGSAAGIFCFERTYGGGSSDQTFRTVIVHTTE